MEFNPLDLLASAAELQYKDEDSSHSTASKPHNGPAAKPHPHQNSSVTPTTGPLKNNIHNNHNNNNHKGGKSSVTVVRKIKLTPELEKMLNEHNYGNAKRNEKYGTHIGVVLEGGGRNDQRTSEYENSEIQSDRAPATEPEGVIDTDCTCPVTQTDTQTDARIQTDTQTHTNSASIDLNAHATGVNDSNSQVECKCGETGDGSSSDGSPVCACTCTITQQHQLHSSDPSDHRTVNSVDPSSCDPSGDHRTVNSVDPSNCDCSRTRSQRTDVQHGVGRGEINNLTSDRLQGQTPDTLDTECRDQCVNKHSSVTILGDQDDSSLSSPDHTACITSVDTGECTSSSTVYKTQCSHMINNEANSQCRHSCSESGASEQCLDCIRRQGTSSGGNYTGISSDSNWKENPSSSSACIDFCGKEGRLSGLVTSDVGKSDPAAIELGAKVLESKSEGSMPGPPSQKVPFVKVVTSEVVGASSKLEQPPTLVINISNKSHSVRKLVHKSGTLETIDVKVQNRNSDDSKGPKIGLIRKLLVPGLSKKQNGDLTGTPPELTIPKCDRLDLAEKSDSCDSLKSLELSDSLCTDGGSSSNVHLLSPDRRNPDSMGIAESPITSVMPELSCPTDCDEPIDTTETRGENENEISEVSDSPAESQAMVAMDNNIRLSGATESELLKDSRLISTPCCIGGKSANGDNLGSECDNEAPIFRFESDHCYAGVPGKVSDDSLPDETDQLSSSSASSSTSLSERGSDCASVCTTSTGTLSPNIEQINTKAASQNVEIKDVNLSSVLKTDALPRVGKANDASMVKNLVPVLISVNSSGCLTVHKDSIVPGKLGSQMFTLDTPPVLDSGMKLFSGTSLSSTRQAPLILSPVGKHTSPVLVSNPPVLVPANSDILGLVGSKTKDHGATQKVITSSSDQVSPPKFGSFKIGTVGAVSNSEMGLEDHLKAPLPSPQLKSLPVLKPAPSRTSGVKTHLLKSSPPIVDTLGTLVQKVRSNLSPASQIDFKNVDHVQHDHDYCMKNLMPSVVNSVLEAKLQKDIAKGKVTHSKLKKSDMDPQKAESKSGKRKRTLSNATKDDGGDFEYDGEDDMNEFGYSHEFVRPKTRAEKYIEQKSAEPKVKITGSSNFQDQFVYFMNTKKRSRRRESRDSPIPIPLDRFFIPPKPGDIVVPHLTDQDIENLKTLSKQAKGIAGANSVRSEFMAAKLSGSSSSSSHNTNSNSQGSSSEPSMDDEKSIINTILSLENENLSSPDQPDTPYNASMEMYGQGLGGADIMSLLPEQMNLTQEQMDLLFSAVDEVQNSSPGLIGSEKLVSSDTGDSTFGQFPGASPFPGTMEVNVETEKSDEGSSAPSCPRPVSQGKITQGDEKLVESTEARSTEGEREKKDDSPSESSGQEESQPSTPTEPQNQSEPTVETSPSEGETGKRETVASSASTSVTPSNSVAPSNSVTPQYTAATTKCSTVSTDVSTSVSQTIAALKVTNESSVTASTAKPLLPSTLISISSESGIPVSTSKPILPSTLTLNSNTIPTSLNTEISLPPLDLLSGEHEFRLDKNDLFSEASVANSSAGVSVLAPAPLDLYSAPWIVTISMFWNDLPAIMINNRPFVRLVDIHKQILPAKDTGILKKRCQLMGIEVDNCSEMQRYFLVQYGKAFNSKSTLIISKDDAKELIGYYVNPQPKSSKSDDHKSIIDHRREQLRRIALARRAAMRAQRAIDKRDEDDPRAIRDAAGGVQELASLARMDSEEPSQAVNMPKSPASKSPAPVGMKIVPVTTPNITAPRATRQKKINFLEMLRGDTNIGNEEEHAAETTVPKKQKVKSSDARDTVKRLKDKKVKIVKYIVETDSSETESNDSESEYSTTDLSVSSESEDVVVVQNSSKHQKASIGYEKMKSKVKTKILPSKSQIKGPLKVKIGSNKRVKPLSLGNQMGVKIMKKSVGTLSPPVSVSKYKSKGLQQQSRDRSLSPHMRSYSPPIIVNKRVMTPPIVTSRSSTPVPNRSGTSSPLLQRSFHPYVDSSLIDGPSLEHSSLSLSDPLHIRAISGNELKITPVLPKEILADTDSCETKEMETNTDYEQLNAEETSGVREVELVNEATNTSDLSGDTVILENSDSEISHDDITTCVNSRKQMICIPNEAPTTELRVTAGSMNGDIHSAIGRHVHNSAAVDAPCQSVHTADTSAVAQVMKRKQIVQVFNTEVPLKIVHRDTSPQDNTTTRHRSQHGEAFVERYNNKKSLCVRCYTCRKMMSVDNFLRHLHDVVTGGLLSLNETRIISASDSELSDSELKLWETFQRKKELFDNNQLPSPDVAFDSDSNQSVPELLSTDTNGMIKTGPLVKTTPVSPVKQNKMGSVMKPRPSVPARRVSHPPVEHVEGTRSSSRKRKVKQLYPFEEYTFGKLPRLQNEKAAKSDHL